MTLNIGINPITWSNDDLPELGGDTSLETCLTDGAKAGYRGFELGNKFPRQSEQLKPVLDVHGLKMVSGWYGAELLKHGAQEEIGLMKTHLKLHQDMGCSVMVFAEVSDSVQTKRDTPVSQRPVMTDDQWQVFTGRINEIAAYLQDQGVPMAYHYHMGTVIEKQHEVDRLMTETNDAVGLLIDSGHMCFAGGDSLELINTYAPRIAHVHCKDVRKPVLDDVLNRDMSFLGAVLNGVFTVPGDGDLDFDRLLAALRGINYQGWLVVEAEQDPSVAPPYEYACKGINHLRTLLEKHYG